MCIYIYLLRNIDVRNKSWTDKEERNLEEEGYYIPEVPNISKKHLKILEQRLFDSENR